MNYVFFNKTKVQLFHTFFIFTQVSHFAVLKQKEIGDMPVDSPLAVHLGAFRVEYKRQYFKHSLLIGHVLKADPITI